MLIVCVGNELSGDDAFGYHVYEKIKHMDVKSIYAYTAPENFLDEIIDSKPERVVLVDAAVFGGRPGELSEISIEDVETSSFSTHRAPLKLFVNRLKDNGIEVRLICVQAVQTGLGQLMSGQVSDAAESLAETISESVKN